MSKLILEPVSNTTFRDIVSKHIANGNTLGETIKHYQSLIRDRCFHFNGIFLPQYGGFLGFNTDGIYMPVGGLDTTIELCNSEEPLVKGSKIFIFKLDGSITYTTI
ncbi:hypothetical protein [Photobacterium damselae]|uniref:hypothetical protein n=1 Tax=Photobacterium damselae TaxID=38293 RepID=UPI001F3CB650|nr:hypothetical protein [Photobacterium damselae]UKA04768.1 hypothetical protein IHC89_21235 [Photobacterium damselae subsp. damselae]